ALDLEVVQGVWGEDRDVVLVGEAAAGGDLEVVEDEVVVGQVLGEPLDRPGLAVVLRHTDSMNDCHDGVTSGGEKRHRGPAPGKRFGAHGGGVSITQPGQPSVKLPPQLPVRAGTSPPGPLSEAERGRRESI